ncbi:MAG: SGNH/GDSL hydrolase family protein [Planctomycetota bacterium]|nr:SGNH/GDSL hydrolase family protein [Planctomycetota bacterium]MDA0933720.1 SGNH/GDSL hydrolase family protein [Planctomycetota bacterium]MDA1222005.1 SGNH/GDSL hydrolase family protein [Planctomycetota bacterium]
MTDVDQESGVPEPTRARRRAIPLLVVGSLLVSAVGAEFVYRWLRPTERVGELYYADEAHVPFDLEDPADFDRAQRYLEVVPDAPRFRLRFKPGVTVHLCYRGYEGEGAFDAEGCVEFRTNSLGFRDREELCAPKPEGQRRVVCLGDSTTVGWGVPEADGWTRRAEDLLRVDDDGVRVANCGASGTLLPDEHAHALFTRFGALDPDVVVVTLCINDLLPVNGGMAHFEPSVFERLGMPLDGWLGHSALVNDAARALRRDAALRLDPDHDWVGALMALPVAEYPPAAQKLGAVYWGSGVPEQALRAIHGWCNERGARLAVMVWPFLQQLGNRSEHPFTPVHDAVGQFCEGEGIAFLDLLDVFLGLDPASLWLTPLDMHGNVRAHALAAPEIARFVGGLLGG